MGLNDRSKSGGGGKGCDGEQSPSGTNYSVNRWVRM